MSLHGYQKMSAKPCKRDAEESLPVRSLSNRKPKPPNCLLIQDKTFYSLGSAPAGKRCGVVLLEERIVGREILGDRDAPGLRRGLRLPLDVHFCVPLCPSYPLCAFGHLLMHDYFLDHPSPLADDRLFGGLGHLNDFLPSGCEVGIRSRTVDRTAFDRDLLLAQTHRFLNRLLFDMGVETHVAVLDFAFAHGDVFFHHRNRDLLLTLYAPLGTCLCPLLWRNCGRSLVRHTCLGVRLLLGSARRRSRA